MKKALALILSFICLLSLLTGCSAGLKASDTGITALKIASDHSKVELYCGEIVQTVSVAVSCKNNFLLNDIQLVNNNQAVASVKPEPIVTGNRVQYTIEGLVPGNTTVFVQTKDGAVKSEEILITVLQDITTIELADSGDITLLLGDGPYKNTFTLQSQREDPQQVNQLEFVSEDEAVAGFELISNSTGAPLQYEITPMGQGETTCYIRTKDGLVVSNKINIIVNQKEETKPVEVAETPVEAPPVIPETKQEPSVDIQPKEETGKTVYITPTGKKYHFSKACAGKNAIETTINQAKVTKDPCKKCAN